MSELVEEKKIRYEGVKGVPHIREAGNALRHRTGNWRVFKPYINQKKCISCKTCFTFCPEGAIMWHDNKPHIDYDVCKGCLICKRECPVRAITAELDLHEEERDSNEK